jgi:hypothetical protein
MSYLLKSLDAVVATGPGAQITFDSVRVVRVAMQVSFTGSPAVSKVQVEVTLDGSNWSGVVDTPDSPANGFYNQGSEFACTAVRANLVSLSGGTSPTVTCVIAAVEVAP